MLMKLRGFVSLLFILVFTFLCFWLVTLPPIVSPSGCISQWIVRNFWAAGLLWFCGANVVSEGQENIVVGKPMDISGYTADDRDRLMDEVRNVISRNKADIEVPTPSTSLLV